MKTKLMASAALMTLFNTAGQAGQEIGVGVQNPTHQVGRGGFGVPRDPRPVPGDADLFERELERRAVAEAARKVEEERRAHEARAEAERARLAEIARIEAEKKEARANDIYPEIYVTNADMFSLYDDDHRTYSFYPEISGWHIFETYGTTDSVMEIYHNGESIVDEGESDGDRGIDDNELQHKYLEAGERYVVQVYLEYWTVRGTVILNVRAEDTPEELYNPLKLGYAKKFWLDPGRTHFTTKFTPKETGWYNIESFSDDEDTVMEIYNPAGHSIVAAGESDGDRGVGDEELQVKKLEAGKTYTIQVYLQDLDDEGFAWVHVWRIS